MDSRNISKFYRNNIVPYSYITPALIFFMLVIMLPVFTSLVLSFYNFSGFDSNIFKEYVGFANFKKLFDYKYFWIALRNTFFFVGASVVVQTGIALFLSIIIFFGNIVASGQFYALKNNGTCLILNNLSKSPYHR